MEKEDGLSKVSIKIKAMIVSCFSKQCRRKWTLVWHQNWRGKSHSDQLFIIIYL